jgi:ribA/ribD-fused uncharacterized protein
MKDKLPDYVTHNSVKISGFFGPYRFLSNFWDAPLEYLNVRYPCVEVAFQAAKCSSDIEREAFKNLDAKAAKRLGRSVLLAGDWESRKKYIMFYLVFQKFSRHKVLRDQLLATDKAILVEGNHWGDKFWGEAFKQTPEGLWVWQGGENHLGKILEQVREALSY